MNQSLINRSHFEMDAIPHCRASSQSCLGAKRMGSKKTHRTILVGLKSSNSSRDMLLRLLSSIVKKGDTVVAVHVQEPKDGCLFDPNSFHMYEDLCQSKKVDFLVKVCNGSATLAVVLTHQVQLHSAKMLVLGCSSTGPKEWLLNSCLNELPHTCILLVMDKGGKILVEQPGNLRQGPAIVQAFTPFLYSSPITRAIRLETKNPCHKSSPIRSFSPPPLRYDAETVPEALHLRASEGVLRQLQRLALLQAKGTRRRFTQEELVRATNNFSPHMVIGKGGRSNVFKANLADGQAAAVKVLKMSQWSGDELIQEVETLSGLCHKHIIQLIGYCYSNNMHAIVYRLLMGSLKQNLARLVWSERMRVAVGVAKALDYLHNDCSPPIIHRDVKSSNILVSCYCEPQLSDFGAAIEYHQPLQTPAYGKFLRVVGTFGYLAPEYMMYGKVDEKIDVYSFGVVLLELITGKEAIQTNAESGPESLVLWARSLLSPGLCERLIDPRLNGNYNKGEVQNMMIAARLCLTHSASRRPTMNMILKLLEEPEHWLELQKEREELFNEIDSEGEPGIQRHVEL